MKTWSFSFSLAQPLGNCLQTQRLTVRIQPQAVLLETFFKVLFQGLLVENWRRTSSCEELLLRVSPPESSGGVMVSPLTWTYRPAWYCLNLVRIQAKSRWNTDLNIRLRGETITANETGKGAEPNEWRPPWLKGRKTTRATGQRAEPEGERQPATLRTASEWEHSEQSECTMGGAWMSETNVAKRWGEKVEDHQWEGRFYSGSDAE